MLVLLVAALRATPQYWPWHCYSIVGTEIEVLVFNVPESPYNPVGVQTEADPCFPIHMDSSVQIGLSMLSQNLCHFEKQK